MLGAGLGAACLCPLCCLSPHVLRRCNHRSHLAIRRRHHALGQPVLRAQRRRRLLHERDLVLARMRDPIMHACQDACLNDAPASSSARARSARCKARRRRSRSRRRWAASSSADAPGPGGGMRPRPLPRPPRPRLPRPGMAVAAPQRRRLTHDEGRQTPKGKGAREEGERGGRKHFARYEIRFAMFRRRSRRECVAALFLRLLRLSFMGWGSFAPLRRSVDCSITHSASASVSDTTCMPRVCHVYPARVCHVYAMCIPRVYHVYTTCIPRVPGTCLPRVYHVYPAACKGGAPVAALARGWASPEPETLTAAPCRRVPGSYYPYRGLCTLKPKPRTLNPETLKP